MDSKILSNLNILSFNWHEPYLCLLAKTAHRFTIVEPEVEKGFIMRWRKELRSIPKNITLMDRKDALSQLESGSFDLAICQNAKDLIFIHGFLLPKILVFHNKLTTEITLGKNKVDRNVYLSSLKNIIYNVALVFISEAKQKDWGLEGTIITPGIDYDEFGGYTGTLRKVLRVGNMVKERDLMMGYTLQEEILKDIPNTLLGQNPTIPEARPAKNWEELKAHYKSHRLFLSTTVNQYEDGYNLSMLEAMATGMPVISVANDTSPIMDGENGFISDDIHYLREKIKFLLVNNDEAKRIGQNGRQTIKEKFGLNKFIEKWEAAITSTVVEFVSNTLKADQINRDKVEINKRKGKAGSKNILLNYVSYPVTTATYFERSFRKQHNVITCGPTITDEIIQKWDLGQIKSRVKDHDILCSSDVDITEILKSLSKSWRPDFYIWIDTGIASIPNNLKKLNIPKACYLIDVHINTKRHLPIAAHFDFVFIAQKEYISCFKEAGCSQVFWLPLACDPDIHKKIDTEKIYDIGFVGSITPAHVRRKKLLNSLSEKYHVHIERCFLDDMSRVFCQSKIIFNDAINNDLNMRVFEALSTGSCLFTDEAPGSGLTDFFKDKKHLIIYNEDNLLELVDYYLSHPGEREEIAQNGYQEVLAKHTYDHRAEQMVNTILKKMREENLISVATKAIIQDLQVPSNDDAIFNEGVRLWNKGEKEKGLQKYCEALKINIENTSALTELVDAVYDLGSFEIAEKYLHKYLSLHPANLNLLLRFAEIQFKLDKIHEAKESLNKIFIFDPAHNDAVQLMRKIEGQSK